MKLYTFTVPPEYDGRLYALARRMLPQEPEYRLAKAFADRDVKQGGVRVSKAAMAEPGAEIKIYLPEGKTLEAPPILYEDENVLIVRKPVGVSCEADAKGGLTLADRLCQACPGRWPVPPVPCHRLDNQTDGLLLLAKTAQAEAELRQAFHDHQVHKRYVCLVKGVPKPEEATLDAWLRKDAQRARVTVLDHAAPGAQPIRTGYRVLQKGEVSRVSVRLYTGRTHQIRAQLAHIGHPLLGDDVYGDRAFNKEHKAKRLMLTATELRFSLTGRLAYLNEKIFTIEPEF